MASHFLRVVISWSLSVLLAIGSGKVCSAQLTDVTLDVQANKTSLYFTVHGSFTHKIFILSQPDRVVIDLNNTDLRVDINKLNLNSTLIRQVRTGRPGPKTLRLVLQVNQPVKISSLPWQRHGGLDGIRLDLIAGSRQITHVTVKQPRHLVAKTQPPLSSTKVTRHQQAQVTHQPSPSLRDLVVVLDAGHGGKDPGAKGPHHAQEKNVVLDITLKLKRLIDQQPGMRAVLTRSGDYYVGLRERLDIARKYNGDVFVSIHADAFNNPHSSGASVFALSQQGATSEAARWIAEKENYSELGGVNLGDLDDTNGIVRSVLIDLSQTATISSGLQMGNRVLSELDRFTRLHNTNVDQARFIVLKSPDIPSILVETGFISNPAEERNLTSQAYQQRLSQAIFQGIKGYFWDNPPAGSRIEAMLNHQTYQVKRGDTLPAIAARYHVSLTALMAINHLSQRSVLKPGQKLAIPSAWV